MSYGAIMLPVLRVLIILVACGTCSSLYSFPKPPFARFEKTEIIDHTCDKSWHIETVESRNIYKCGLKCNRFTDCRRFLFCETKSKCALYGDGTDCVLDGDATGCHCFRKLIGCNGVNCICPWGHYGDYCQHIVTDCADAVSKGIRCSRNVITRIKPILSKEAFDVICKLNLRSHLTILYRLRKCEGENFNRTWSEYEQGFGSVPWNSWLGLKKIQHILNNQTSLSLRILLSNTHGESCSIFYDNVRLGDASTKYQFQARSVYTSIYRPTCGDSMIGLNNTLDLRGRPFSTYDQDETSNGCAARFGGGWWFADHPNCSDGFLTATLIVGNIWSGPFWDSDIEQITMKLTSDA